MTTPSTNQGKPYAFIKSDEFDELIGERKPGVYNLADLEGREASLVVNKDGSKVVFVRNYNVGNICEFFTLEKQGSIVADVAGTVVDRFMSHPTETDDN